MQFSEEIFTIWRIAGFYQVNLFLVIHNFRGKGVKLILARVIKKYLTSSPEFAFSEVSASGSSIREAPPSRERAAAALSVTILANTASGLLPAMRESIAVLKSGWQGLST